MFGSWAVVEASMQIGDRGPPSAMGYFCWEMNDSKEIPGLNSVSQTRWLHRSLPGTAATAAGWLLSCFLCALRQLQKNGCLLRQHCGWVLGIVALNLNLSSASLALLVYPTFFCLISQSQLLLFKKFIVLAMLLWLSSGSLSRSTWKIAHHFIK